MEEKVAGNRVKLQLVIRNVVVYFLILVRDHRNEWLRRLHDGSCLLSHLLGDSGRRIMSFMEAWTTEKNTVSKKKVSS
jgi:hypothetical protein